MFVGECNKVERMKCLVSVSDVLFCVLCYNSEVKNWFTKETISEDDTLDAILASAEFMVNKLGHHVIIMNYGRKQIILVLDKDKRLAQTRIDRMREEGAVPNETTILYEAAKIVMKRYASHCGFDFTYKVSTSDEKMNLWANSKGRELFDFSPVEGMRDEFKYNYSSVISSKE